MTTATITAQLPNGFHDAVLRELHVDFAKQEVRLGFQFWVGDLDAEAEEAREAMRSGTLRLTGVTSMLIVPPDPCYHFSMDDGVYADGDFGVYPGEPEAPEDGLVRLWLYSPTLNARMMFTARACELAWAI